MLKLKGKNNSPLKRSIKFRFSTAGIFAVLLSTQVAMGQDPVSSHFWANGIMMNPALAGSEGPAKVHIGYRNQWPNTGKSFLTYQAAYDQYISKLGGGVGIRLMNDQQGDGTFNLYNLDLMYSYHFKVSRRLTMAGGLQAGVGQKSFSSANLVFADMIDPVTGGASGGSAEIIEGYRAFYPDFAAGVAAFYQQKFYGGIAVHHLLNPVVLGNDDINGVISRRYTAHFGATFPVIERRRGKEIMKLAPNFTFIQQLSVQQIHYGLDVLFKDFLAGLYTRHDMGFTYGNIIFTMGYVTESLRLRYSYDLKVSSPDIRLPGMGAHEFSLVFTYDNPSDRNKRRAIKCPKI